MNKEEFICELKKRNIDITEEQSNQLDIYCDFLIEKNKITNLTAITSKESIYLKHFLDSILTLEAHHFKANDKILDIGTGAGFPGMIIAILNPDTNVELLDSNNKKIEFLKELITKLNLSNALPIHMRAEEYYKIKKDTYDVVIARAVSNLNMLSELCIPFVKKDGYFISMKGKINEELEESKEAIEILGGEIELIEEYILPVENSNRTIIKIRKKLKTPSIYPRRYDKILKYPLKKGTK